MRYIILLALFTVLCSSQSAFAVTVSGNVFGQWTVTDSPVMVNGDLVVPAGNSLTIDAGVSILFTGPYSITVNGELRAFGTTANPIRFTRATVSDTSRWGGIRFVESDDTSVLNYCVIEYTYKNDEEASKVRGGALRILNTSPTIKNNTIRFNTTVNSHQNGMGGAIFITGNSTSLIENNVVSYNVSDSGGAIAVGSEGRPIIRHNEISHNVANYTGGGIFVGAWGHAEIDGNIIRENSALGWGGGGIALWNNSCDVSASCTKVFNNVIYRNRAESTAGTGYGNGGGIYSRYDGSDIYNNTILTNAALGEGGGVFTLNQGVDFPFIANSIIRSNTAATGTQLAVTGDGAQLIADYNNIEEGWVGSGNIDQQPFFVNVALGLLRYMPGSAGIDAGDSALDELPLTDINGKNRELDGDENGSFIVDMGAFEFDPTASLPADINGDTNTTLVDTISILQLMVGKDVVVGGNIQDIDVNGDGVISMQEAIYSLNFLK